METHTRGEHLVKAEGWSNAPTNRDTQRLPAHLLNPERGRDRFSLMAQTPSTRPDLRLLTFRTVRTVYFCYLKPLSLLPSKLIQTSKLCSSPNRM